MQQPGHGRHYRIGISGYRDIGISGYRGIGYGCAAPERAASRDLLLPADWDEIPGARGCTPQNCAFRNVYSEFVELGVAVFGVSTQTTAFQADFKARNHVPFDYLSDCELQRVSALHLPTFELPVESGGPNPLIKRMAWFVEHGRIAHVWYPVFPPHERAARVLEWLVRSREV
jgi:peroxiredoxin